MPPPRSVDPVVRGRSRPWPPASKLRKLAAIARVSRYRRALRLGVAAAVEHGRVAFRGDFRTVVDAGAHQGQFALFSAERFPRAAIHCFEPLAGPRERLARVSKAAIPNELTIHPVALGSSEGEAVMHLSRRDDSSSLLAIAGEQERIFPGTGEVGKATVEVARLDAVLSAARLRGPALLKIDVQGYELEVLRGAEGILDAFDEILVEASFTELYEDQPGADEVVAHLLGRGFRLTGVHGLVDTPEGSSAQADFHFRRQPPAR